MPKLVNENPTPVRVRRPGEPSHTALVRIRAGQVVDADGAYADALLAAGLVPASDDQVAAHDDDVDARRNEHTGPATRLGAKLALGPARIALRHATVAAPLRRVVGDDQAPYGPPSGVVTTKGLIVEGTKPGDPDRTAFAENEAIPGERVEGGELDLNDQQNPPHDAPAADVHNAQVTNAEAAEAVAQALVQGQADAGALAAGDGGQPEDEPFDLAKANKIQLEQEADRRGLSVTGTGANGTVKADDLRKAIKADDEQPSGDA